jgi:predicted ArsR family transcriptional regulator
MAPENLSDDLVAILDIIREKGGTDCSGTCHHRKPGEFHCHTLSQELKISSSGVKERILELVRNGYLQRNRLERQGTYPLTRFTVSEKGMKVLATHCNHDEK